MWQRARKKESSANILYYYGTKGSNLKLDNPIWRVSSWGVSSGITVTQTDNQSYIGYEVDEVSDGYGNWSQILNDSAIDFSLYSKLCVVFTGTLQTLGDTGVYVQLTSGQITGISYVYNANTPPGISPTPIKDSKLAYVDYNTQIPTPTQIDIDISSITSSGYVCLGTTTNGKMNVGLYALWFE